MTLSTRAPRLKRFKRGAALVATAGLGWILFTALRTRQLLHNSRQIAARSAGFPRDYYLGSGPELTYLVMGDSTAAGWGSENLNATYPHQIATWLAARGQRVHVVNVAVGGAILADVTRVQSRYLQSVRPDFITLSVGANDATHGTSSANFERELQLLMADLGASGAQTVLMANVPDMFLAPALPMPFAAICARRARAFNTILASLPASRVRIIDLFGRGRLDYRRDPKLYAADLFHPSGRGYAVWTPLWIEAASREAKGTTQQR